jgi:acyl carrier protein
MKRTQESLPKVLHFVAQHLGVEAGELSEATSFLYDLGLDSFAALQFVCDAEDAFGCRIANEKIKDIQTIGDLARLLDSREA